MYENVFQLKGRIKSPLTIISIYGETHFLGKDFNRLLLFMLRLNRRRRSGRLRSHLRVEARSGSEYKSRSNDAQKYKF